MKKQFLLQIGIIVFTVFVTYGLMSYSPKKQDRRINLSVTVQETELILKALSELPLKESGGLFSSIQQQATAQLTPTKIDPPKQQPMQKADSGSLKDKKH